MQGAGRVGESLSRACSARGSSRPRRADERRRTRGRTYRNRLSVPSESTCRSEEAFSADCSTMHGSVSCHNRVCTSSDPTVPSPHVCSVPCYRQTSEVRTCHSVLSNVNRHIHPNPCSAARQAHALREQCRFAYRQEYMPPDGMHPMGRVRTLCLQKRLDLRARDTAAVRSSPGCFRAR